jgi:hypothetical protein
MANDQSREISQNILTTGGDRIQSAPHENDSHKHADLDSGIWNLEFFIWLRLDGTIDPAPSAPHIAVRLRLTVQAPNKMRRASGSTRVSTGSE